MTPIALLRHGLTAWNTEGRIQGSRDIPLSTEGRALIAQRTPPAELRDWAWVTSPRMRCLETLKILHKGGFATDERVAEMRWGAWEGQRLTDLREAGLTAARESLGLDFRPPGGESPRELQVRITPFLADVARAGQPTVLVTHKGVIRALLSLATGWDMRDKPPARLDWTRAHLFLLAADGVPSVDRLNMAMEAA